LKEITEQQLKGKKNAKHHALLLTYMLDFAKEPRQKIEILLNLLNSIFSTSKTANPAGFLTREGWIGCHNHVQSLLTHLDDPSLKATLSVQSKRRATDEHIEHDESSGNMEIERAILPSLISFL
jgi:Eukaryotic translation initiation factor 3 subunit 8 N-terminus